MNQGSISSTEGFTLIEVMIAMIILAIGLLALEGLGLQAVRSITQADRASGYAALARDSLESALHTARAGRLPVQFCLDGLPFGARLSRQVDVSVSELVRIIVQVTFPSTSDESLVEEFRLESSLYMPQAEGDPPIGAPCG